METIGSCLCGKIKFKILEMNNKAYHCHCKTCQKISGGIFSTYINLKKDQIAWGSNEPSYYNSSENVQRGFSEACGASIFYEALNSGKIDIHVGTIEDKSKLMLIGHNGIESRLENFKWEDYLPKFES